MDKPHSNGSNLFTKDRRWPAFSHCRSEDRKQICPSFPCLSADFHNCTILVRKDGNRNLREHWMTTKLEEFTIILFSNVDKVNRCSAQESVILWVFHFKNFLRCKMNPRTGFLPHHMKLALCSVKTGPDGIKTMYIRNIYLWYTF